MSLAIRLKTARINAGLSQRELSRQLGIGHNAIGRYESAGIGSRGPKKAHMEKIETFVRNAVAVPNGHESAMRNGGKADDCHVCDKIIECGAQVAARGPAMCEKIMDYEKENQYSH